MLQEICALVLTPAKDRIKLENQLKEAKKHTKNKVEKFSHLKEELSKFLVPQILNGMYKVI